MLEPEKVKEPRTPSVKFLMTPDKEDGQEPISPNSPCPSSPFSRMASLSLQESSWEIPTLAQGQYAMSEPGYSILRASNVSPRMTQLASGLADMRPFTGRLDLPARLPSPLPYNSPQTDSASVHSSSSMSSMEDFNSATTDSLDITRFDISRFDDELNPVSDLIYSPEMRHAAATSPSIPRYGSLGFPLRNSSDGTRVRSRARTMHAERPTPRGEACEVAPSPTRSRGGVPTPPTQRTTNFLSNPRPAPNRARRESLSRPKPRLSESVELPKSLPALSSGLIPPLPTLSSSSSNSPPASPSRPPPRLPSFHRGDVNCHRITHQTLTKLINGDFSHLSSEFFVLDCRSEPEFAAGHLRGAIHCPDPSVAIQQFIIHRLPHLRALGAPSTTILVFHCEFSQRRGPQAMEAFRLADREQNSYPDIFYPDIYCLDGGYAEIYNTHPELCDPLGYLTEPVKDHRSSSALRRSHSISRIAHSQSLGNLPSMDEADELENDKPAFVHQNPLRTRAATVNLKDLARCDDHV